MKNKLFILIIVGVVSVFTALIVFKNNEDSSNVTPGAQPQLKLTDIHGLEVAIDDPEKLYLPNHQGLYSQESDGLLQKVGGINDDLMSFAISPTKPDVFYASGHPKTGGNIGLIKTMTSGVSWENVSEGLDGPVDFHTMAIDNNDEQLVYGYYRGALQRSNNEGANWQYLVNAPDQIIQLSAGPNKGQLYAATVTGLWLSEDNGDSWVILESIKETVIAVEVNAASGKLFAYGVNSGLLVSDSKGETWEKINLDSNNKQVLYITSSKTNPDRVYFVTKSLEIYKSTDGGMTWNLR